ncbi:MAG: hypothetical protein FJZ67_08530 [Bacteroidetes bacterium]|nr:hypothetical protein [Bacteroidota bacterium]
MSKTFLVLGVSAGVISTFVSFLFAYFFNQNLFNFSNVLPYWKIVSVDFTLALTSAGVYYGITFISKIYSKIIFNSLFALCSIVSVLMPITAKLEGIEFPEFYPTFALPLYMFFSVIFLALSSIFIKDEK